MISHDHKLIFIHIPKCAGRSVMSFFNSARPDHFTARYYEKEYSRFVEYKIFSIVRNPYDRLVSIYHYVLQHRRNQFEPIIVNAGNGFKEWLITNYKHYRPFNKKSAEGQWGSDGLLGSPFFFSPQGRWLNSLNKIKIFKYENIGDVEVFLRNELNDDSLKLPLLNASNHLHWSMYYDEELIKHCRDIEAITNDCKLYGYEIL